MKQLKNCSISSHICNACKYTLYGKRCKPISQKEIDEFKAKRAFISVMG